MQKEKSIINLDIYTDGACRGNPGYGSWGVVIYINGELHMKEGHAICDENDNIIQTTNNIAELKAAIKGLYIASVAIEGFDHNLYDINIVINVDSNYVKMGITSWIHKWKQNGWKTAARKPVANVNMWKKLYLLDQQLHPVWKWIPREKNTEADKEANKALDRYLDK